MNSVSKHRTAQASGFARAAPVGGACFRQVRGRALMLGALIAMASSTAQSENLLAVPSGQPVELSDVLLDNNPGELWLRFRFVAPKIGSTAGKIGYDVASIDMIHLCEALAIPYIDKHQLEPALVVISFSDRAVEFGNSAPDATQFFESYRLEQSQCVWEGF